MMNVTEWSGLLEFIAEKSGCLYLSDLHSKCRAARIRNAIAVMCPSEYGAGEWCDAIGYITGKPVSFENSNEAAEYLKGWLLNSAEK